MYDFAYTKGSNLACQYIFSAFLWVDNLSCHEVTLLRGGDFTDIFHQPSDCAKVNACRHVRKEEL